MSGGNNNEREFANYVCKMYQYNYLFEFLKKKIGHDCARQIVMMHFRRDPNYGDIENISDYAIRRAMRTTRLRMPPTALATTISAGNTSNSATGSISVNSGSIYAVRITVSGLATLSIAQVALTYNF